VKNEISTKFKLSLYTGNSVIVKGHTNLFKTKEEAGLSFLKSNDIPAELLKVLMPKKNTTTVSALIEKLSTIDPELDLEDDFWDFLKEVKNRYVHNIATGKSLYWVCPVCNCVSTVCPDSHVEEMTGENMAKEGQ